MVLLEKTLEIQGRTEPNSSFSVEDFFDNCTCAKLGQRIAHFPIISSTENVFGDNTEKWSGLVALADRQTQGKGRKRNQWISPGGSLSMSFGFEVGLELEHLAPIQHLVGLAAVKALRKMTGSKEIFCKWPNDLYWNRDVKLGGIITRASCMGSRLTVCVGIGINLTNVKPFPGVSILSNVPCPREILISEIFNTFEGNLENLKDGSWRDEYTELWLHSNEKVIFEGLIGVVKGVDLDGYLLVERVNGEYCTIDTDNNSFDLMKGLIHRKR